jgi:hypothetical protein
MRCFCRVVTSPYARHDPRGSSPMMNSTGSGTSSKASSRSGASDRSPSYWARARKRDGIATRRDRIPPGTSRAARGSVERPRCRAEEQRAVAGRFVARTNDFEHLDPGECHSRRCRSGMNRVRPPVPRLVAFRRGEPTNEQGILITRQSGLLAQPCASLPLFGLRTILPDVVTRAGAD